MLKSPLQLKSREIAGAGNFEDILEFLDLLRTEAGNVHTDIGEHDSIELRKAIDKYLQNAIDTVRRIRKNELTQGPVQNDDV